MDKEKRKFIIRQGMIGVGLPSGVLSAIVMAWWINPGGTLFKSLLLELLVMVPFMMCGGLVCGLIMWKYVQRKKRRVADNQPRTDL